MARGHDVVSWASRAKLRLPFIRRVLFSGTMQSLGLKQRLFANVTLLRRSAVLDWALF